MAWIVLLVAGLFEVGMVMGLNFSEEFTKLWPSLLMVVSGGDKLLPALGGHAERPRRHGLRGVDGHRGQRRGTSGDLVPGRAREPAAGNGDSRRARRRAYAKARRRMKRLVSDELWELVEPLLPPEPDKPKGGRPRVPARSVLEGIVYVLKSGIPWSMLPKELGCSGVTCWRRLRDWQKAGVWHGLRRLLLDKLGKLGLIDWSRASVDSASIPAKKGERRPA